MGLGIALNNAYTGLVANGRMAEVTANNIANAATPGYTRRSVDLAAQAVDGRGSGVLIEGVSIARAEVLTNERRRADAATGEQQTLADTRQTLTRLAGGPDDPGSLFSRYEALEGSLRALSNEPSASHLQLDVVTKTKDLSTAFNEINTGLTEARQDIDGEIGRTVNEINRVLGEIDRLNYDVQRETVNGLDATESTSRRDALIDEISELLPVKTATREHGRVAVLLDSGFALVDGSPVTLEFTPASVVDPTMDLVGGAPGALSGITVSGSDITPFSTTPETITGGKLKALFEARDVSMVAFQESVDALAEDLISRFSAPAVEPGNPGGQPGLFTDGGTVATGAPGAAGRLQINAAVDPSQSGDLWRLRDGIFAAAQGDAGDNTHLVQMLGAMTDTATMPAASRLAGVSSAADHAAGFATLLEADSVSADATLAMRSARQSDLVESEARVLGVDTDYELQNLEMIRNAYSANARVMEVVNSLFGRLLEI